MKLAAHMIRGNLTRARRVYLEAEETLCEETLLGELTKLIGEGGRLSMTREGTERIFLLEDSDE